MRVTLIWSSNNGHLEKRALDTKLFEVRYEEALGDCLHNLPMLIPAQAGCVSSIYNLALSSG